MKNTSDPIACWNRAAKDASFTHPFDREAFAALVPQNARVLDIGCGYGRTVAALALHGYENVTGLDVSPAMIERGRNEHPGLDLRLWQGETLPFQDGVADAAVLFAVLTCIPEDMAQDDLLRETRRVLTPGGILYVSDYPIQVDERNRQRYRASRPPGMPYGVFSLPDGSVFRHHDEGRIASLFAGFERVSEKEITVTTFKGNAAQAFQIFLKKPGP